LDRAEQKGEEKKEISTILKLIAKGKSVEEISELLDISIEAVQQVIENQ